MTVLTLYMKESCLLCDKAVHPHSFYKLANATDLVNPITRRAASFWIFCNVSESCSEQHTIQLTHIL